MKNDSAPNGLTPDEEIQICKLVLEGNYQTILSTYSEAVMDGLVRNKPPNVDVVTLKFIHALLPKLENQKMNLDEAYKTIFSANPDDYNVGKGTPRKAANAFVKIFEKLEVYMPQHNKYDPQNPSLINSQALLKLVGIPLNGPSMVQAIEESKFNMPQQNSGHTN
jgi:hypothetical protein